MDSIKIFSKRFSELLNNRLFLVIICSSTGLLSAIPYYFEKLFVFTFISLFVLFYIVISQRRANKGVFLPFFVYFFGFYFFVYIFLSELYPYDYFGFTDGQGIFIMICSCLIIPMLHSAVEALVMTFAKLIPDNTLFPLGMASVWVLGEALLSIGTLAFPWANISISLTGWLPFLQTASLFGKSFISFITVFCSVAFAEALFDKKKFLSYAALTVLICNIISGYILWFIPIKKSSSTETAIVQGNVLFNEKWNYENQFRIFEKYTSMTEEAARSGAKLIILPEGAIPAVFKENGKIHKAFGYITNTYDVTVIIGIHYITDTEQHNSVVTIYPDGSLSERYDKLHLVPFSEFIPFSDFIGKFIPFVEEFSEDSGVYQKGDGYRVFETEFGDISPLICFDSIFPQLAKDSVKGGATLLAVVTNDSWFNDSVGIYTHLRHSQLRAIENRRFVIRGANTGISAFINQRGEIIKETQPLVEDTIYNDVYNIESLSLYTRTGDLVFYASVLIIIFILIDHIRRNKNGKNAIAPDRNL